VFNGLNGHYDISRKYPMLNGASRFFKLPLIKEALAEKVSQFILTPKSADDKKLLHLWAKCIFEH
jgi:hypothetical protein